nr:chitobiase/beta-hexosaminidase C-terminal domain-containing protein [Prosthecobacter vanneervenii]
MITEIPLPDGENCHELTLIQHVTPDALVKVSTPTVTQEGAAIALTCTTAGASIYYTLDGTFPGSGNAAASLYTAPISLESGIHQMRVCAQKDGMQASNDLIAEITIE